MYTAASYTAINTPITATPKTGFFSLIGQLVALRNQRKALAGMDDAQLQDLGLSYADAQDEAARPFWDVPANWTH